jgi:hypothetical protein
MEKRQKDWNKEDTKEGEKGTKKEGRNKDTKRTGR